jgi:hypothetical protein
MIIFLKMDPEETPEVPSPPAITLKTVPALITYSKNYVTIQINTESIPPNTTFSLNTENSRVILTKPEVPAGKILVEKKSGAIARTI